MQLQKKPALATLITTFFNDALGDPAVVLIYGLQ